MQEEIWKDVPNYVGYYQVSNLGRVKSISFKDKNLIRKTTITNGYHRVSFTVKRKVKSLYVHRLIGESFIPNPDNKPCINHKNGIKTDNSISNLEWVTHQENAIHKINVLGYVASAEARIKLSISQKGRIISLSHRDKISKNSTSVKKVQCINTGKIWNSIKLCAEDLNINYSQLRHSLNNNNKHNKNIKYYNYDKA